MARTGREKTMTEQAFEAMRSQASTGDLIVGLIVVGLLVVIFWDKIKVFIAAIRKRLAVKSDVEKKIDAVRTSGSTEQIGVLNRLVVIKDDMKELKCEKAAKEVHAATVTYLNELEQAKTPEVEK